jgi:heterogeneous nuclear ribonucleoprotein R
LGATPALAWSRTPARRSRAVTEEQLKNLFEHLGEITKVILPPAKAGHENRYGFVHFKERYMAIKALKKTERYELDGEFSYLTSFYS